MLAVIISVIKSRPYAAKLCRWIRRATIGFYLRDEKGAIDGN